MKTPLTIDKAGAKVLISGSYTLLDTTFGLQVKFDGVHHLEITVPGEYFNKVQRCAPRFIKKILKVCVKHWINTPVHSSCVACVGITTTMKPMTT